MEVDGEVSVFLGELDAEQIPVGTGRAVPDNASELTFAVRKRKLSSDGERVIDQHADAVRAYVLHVPQLLIDPLLVAPGNHYEFDVG